MDHVVAPLSVAAWSAADGTDQAGYPTFKHNPAAIGTRGRHLLPGRTTTRS
jgi:hypothetical protein